MVASTIHIDLWLRGHHQLIKVLELSLMDKTEGGWVTFSFSQSDWLTVVPVLIELFLKPTGKLTKCSDNYYYYYYYYYLQFT